MKARFGITTLAIRQRFLTILAGILLIGAGLWAFNQLKIEAYPDISDTQVVVITTFPGRAAEEVEQQVTVPIERALNSVPDVIARRSRTIFGLSVVELTFKYGTNDYFARQVSIEKLRDADLPDGVTPTLGPLSTPIGELYRYSLVGNGISPMKLRELQDWVVAPRLLQVQGVADITPFGGLIRQFQVNVNPLSLSKYNLSIQQIVAAVSSNNSNVGGAMLDNKQQSMVIRGVGQVRSVSDIEGILVSENNGTAIFVRDIGKVEIGAAPQTGIFGVNDKTGGVEGIVLMRRGENPSDVLRDIKDAVTDLNTNRLPSGVHLEPIYDRTELVNNTLHTVSHTLLEGLVVVVGVLLFFLGSVRAALLTALTIPLAMLFAFVCMHFAGIPANLLSLGALDFGVIVDATLVMVEHVIRKLSDYEKMPDQQHFFEQIPDIIRHSAEEVSRPIFFSLAIIISAYIPLFTLERVERRLFTPMAWTVCFAMFGSMLLALTLIPVLATFLFGKGGKHWHNPLLDWLTHLYEHVLAFTVRRPWVVASGATSIVLASFALGASLGIEFLPSLDEGVLWIRANFPAGISLDKSSNMAADIRKLVSSYPEVELVSSQTGRNDSGTDPYGPNRNELFVALKPYETWPAGMNKAGLVSALSHRLNDEIPGANFSFTQPIVDNVTEAVTGSAADLAIIIRGPDLRVLRQLAEQTLELVRKVPGSADSAVEQESDQSQLRIAVNRDAVSRYGINVRDVEDVIEMAIGGKAAGQVYEGERKFDIVVRYIAGARSDVSMIGNILIPTREGGRVPLQQLASIEVCPGASIIARRENQRQITVRTNIRGRDQGGFAAAAMKVFEKGVKLPDGYRVEWGGQFENLQRAQKRLTIIMPITILVIFALLFFMFGKAGDALLVLVNVPFSLVGGILLLYLRGINLSVSAAVGFISLFGVAVMSGLLYISEINRRRADGMPLIESVVTGATTQLRPRLILIVVALMGMVPAARAFGIGSDVQRPLATVVVGGLISTLLLTLTALPAFYLIFQKKSDDVISS